MTIDKSFFRHVWAAAGSIVAALLVQTAGAIYWAGSISARVDAVEKNVVQNESRLHEHEMAQMATANKKENR